MGLLLPSSVYQLNRDPGYRANTPRPRRTTLSGKAEFSGVSNPRAPLATRGTNGRADCKIRTLSKLELYYSPS